MHNGIAVANALIERAEWTCKSHSIMRKRFQAKFATLSRYVYQLVRLVCYL